MASFDIYKDKTVLITGHTGFKGSWLTTWLLSLGAKVVGVSLDVVSVPSNFQASFLSDSIEDHRVDILNADSIKKLIHQVKPDFIFHLAAQALVRPSYVNPIDTMKINAIGSANLLDALRTLDKKVIVLMITSDKAYDNVEWLWGYRENDRLGGKDPYSASKAMAEMVIRSFIESYFNDPDSQIRVGIARAGNVIGGGDWAKDRIVPDCMVAWNKNEIVNIRSPHSTRPWQHVLEPLSGYLLLGASLFESNENHSEAYNFGPPANQNHSVSELIDEMGKYWDQIRWKDVSIDYESLHEAGLLKLNCDKAQFNLNWQSTLDFLETVKMTVDWYKVYYENQNHSMYNFTKDQILEYTKLANMRQLSWAKND
jgi:CDP-glucose 4,6-dehydratase